MKKKLVIFDLDGTLLDTLEDIRSAINYTLSLYDIPQITREETMKYVGHGLRNALFSAIEKSGKYIEENDLALMNEILVSRYLKHPDDNTRPYDGITELLEWLIDIGVGVAVASNKKDELVKRIIKDTLPFIPFTFILGENKEYPLKPDPRGILNKITKLNLTKDDIVYVGDSEVDWETGKNIGCDCCIVNYGFRTKQELENKGITNTVDSPNILKRVLQSMLE